MVSVTKYPTSATEEGSGVAWMWESAIYSSGTAQAQNTSGSCATTKKLTGSNYGFNIPANARVTGVQINIRYANSTPSSSSCLKVHACSINAGGLGNQWTNVAYIPGTNTNSLKTWTIGGEGNLLGLSSNPAYYNSGVVVKYWATVANGYVSYVDYITVTIYYTLPAYSMSGYIDSEEVLGEAISYSVTLTNTNNTHQGVPIPVTISLPQGLSYASQSGNGIYNPSTGKWNAELVNYSATLNLVLTSSSTGVRAVTATVDTYGTSISKTTNILPASYVLDSQLPVSVVQGTNLTYDITVNTNSPIVESVEVNISLPAGFNYVSSTGSGTYNSETHVWTAEFTDKIATRTFTLTAVTPGDYIQTISITDGPSLSEDISIFSATVTECFSTSHELPLSILNYMKHGEKYTISCYSKISDSSLTSIFPGLKNFKIAIVQGTNENLGSRVSDLDVIERIFVSFIYDENETPLLKQYGQYVGISPGTAQIRFFGFAIHHGDDVFYEDPGILFNLPDKLIQNEDYATATLPAGEKSTPMVLDEINLSGRESDTNLIIKGLAISLDYYVDADIGIRVSITTSKTTSTKTLILNPSESNILIGSSTDKWGLDDIDLTDLNVIIEFSNIFSENMEVVQVKNVEFILYSQHDETMGNEGFTLDNEHSRNYNIFCKDFDKPEGVIKDIETLDLKRSDGEIITGASIKSKKIKVKFYIVGNTLEEMQERLIDAVGWMSNNNDDGGIPIPKVLKFDWDQRREYEVVLLDAVSVNYDIGEMECEAEFLLPKGVATSPVTYGAEGSNDGLTKVRPLITIKADGSASITVLESYSNQSITLNHEFAASTILNIDFESNKVYGLDYTDYTEHITLNSDNILLDRGPFDFSESEGCIVQKVQFKEGR